MIHRLRGILVEKDTEGVVLDVGGVGYRASASLGTLRALPSLGEECVIHTRMVVREDAMLLFGFAAPEERAAFDALTAVSKIGPKLALAVLWYSLEEAEKALNSIPPQDSVEKYIKEALRRIGSRR